MPHTRVDVQEIGCDFYAISGHKMYAPTGIGVLYGRRELLEAMPPWQGGGDMIASVSFEETTYNSLPFKFEAGTPNIEGVIGLGAAIDFLERVGVENIAAHESDLLQYATKRILEIPGIRIIGTAERKASVLSFVLDDVHAHDVGTIMDFEGVAIRAGHHCAMPVMECFNVPATARASFAVYNTREEVDALIAAVGKVREVFG
jgi:cysteine desulfurase/selenocysteine lyase